MNTEDKLLFLEKNKEKWDEIGLVAKENKQEAEFVAALMENQRLVNETVPSEGERQRFFAKVSIPLARRVFGNFVPWELVSCQAMLSPNCIYLWTDQYGNVRQGQMVARTRLLKNCIPLIEAPAQDDGLVPWYGGGLYIEGEFKRTGRQEKDEIELVRQVSCKIHDEICHEILSDLRNVAGTELTHNWLNLENFVDFLMIATSKVSKKGKEPNWAVMNEELADRLLDVEDYQPAEKTSCAVYHHGKLNKWKVFAETSFSDDVFLLGYHGGLYDSGYIYSPYVPFYEMPKSSFQGEEILKRYGLSSRYGKKLVDANYYAKVRIENYE